MSRIKCVVEYDGFNYMGFQVQDDLDTVEKRITDAIYNMTGEEVKIYPSGRTDRKVHAKGQVFHFESTRSVKPYGWVLGINAFLPKDIRILSAEEVDSNFHARFSAIKKEYHYYIMKQDDVFLRRYAVYIPKLDITIIREALNKLVGTHDFKGFASAKIDSRKETVKTIYEIKLNETDRMLEFIFIGDGFLKYQIRKMMGLIIEIGAKREPLSKIDDVFKTLDPKLTNKMAKGEGLFLDKVYY